MEDPGIIFQGFTFTDQTVLPRAVGILQGSDSPEPFASPGFHQLQTTDLNPPQGPALGYCTHLSEEAEHVSDPSTSARMSELVLKGKIKWMEIISATPSAMQGSTQNPWVRPAPPAATAMRNNINLQHSPETSISIPLHFELSLGSHYHYLTHNSMFLSFRW